MLKANTDLVGSSKKTDRVGVGVGGVEEGGAMSHHLGVMLTVTGDSRAKGEGQERPAQQAGEVPFGSKGRSPWYLEKMSPTAGPESPQSPGFATNAPPLSTGNEE